MRINSYHIVSGAALAALLTGCGAAPIKISSTGSIPGGPQASFTMAEDVVDTAWLSASDISQCLIRHGMQPSTAPAYLVQYSVAIRPATNSVLTGNQTIPPPKLSRKDKRGDRIVYQLIIDGLQNNERAYTLSIDAAYQAKSSSPASRAAQLCSALNHKAD